MTSTSRSCQARCMRSSARTDRASRRSSRSSPVSTSPIPNPEMSLRIRGEEVTFPMHAGKSSRPRARVRASGPRARRLRNGPGEPRVRNYNTGFAWRVPWRRERQYVRKLLAEFGVTVSPDRLIGSLNQVVKAQVAIARAFDQLRGVDNGLLGTRRADPVSPSRRCRSRSSRPCVRWRRAASQSSSCRTVSRRSST